MNIGLYFLIFISKVIENGLSTMRLIVVANGKKFLGAFLNFAVALVWILVTGIVVTNITSDPLKILFFALGSLVGSYTGSIIEEKIALGDILINCITENKNLIKKLENKYTIYTLKDNKNQKYISLFIISRKEKKEIISLIKSYDKNALIFSEKVKDFSND